MLEDEFAPASEKRPGLPRTKGPLFLGEWERWLIVDAKRNIRARVQGRLILLCFSGNNSTVLHNSIGPQRHFLRWTTG